ncbi:MAG: cobalamin-binding protein, partial [Candidatus Neomarinimicrobiota bacterium]
MTTEKDSLYNAVLLGDKKSVLTILKNRVTSGVSVIDLIDRVMIPAVKEVGEKFSRNEIYVSEMLLSARALQAGLNFLKPFMGDERKRKAGLKIAVGTVKGDLHEIGK